jgi:hypothetical protein
MPTFPTRRHLAALLIMAGAASCTAIAGLDGHYVVGEAGGAGGVAPTSTTASATTGGMGGTGSSMGGQGASGGSTSTGRGGSGGSGAAGGGGSGGGLPDCAPIGLVDAFNGSAVNQTNWNLQGETNMLVVGGGTLRLDGGQPNVNGGWSGLVTPQTFMFQGRCVWVEVLNVHHNGTEGGTYWQLYSNQGSASFTVSGGMLELHIATSGNPVDVALPYSPTNHRWWRMREDAGTLYLETSPAGTVWSERINAPSPSYLSDVAVGLGVTGANTQPIVGYTELDNLNVPP